MRAKFIGLVVGALLAVGLMVAPAFALSVAMRPAAGQPAPSTVTQIDGSVVTPDANGNFVFTFALNIGNQLAQGWVMTAPGNSVNALGNVSAGTVNVDLSKGCLVTETLTGNITQTFTNAVNCKSQPVIIEATQDATGSRTITWSGFSGITPPQPVQTANKTDEVVFADDGTNVTYPIAGYNPGAWTLTLYGSTSGSAVITPPAAAGTPTLTLPTTSGTILTTASSATFPSMLTGSANATASNSAANVFPGMGNGTPVATTSEGTVDSPMPVAGTLSNLECYLTNAAGTKTVAGGTNYVMAVRQNLASGTLTCTIGSAATNCTDTTAGHNMTVAIGDQIDYIDTPSGTPTALIPHCAVKFVQ